MEFEMTAEPIKSDKSNIMSKSIDDIINIQYRNYHVVKGKKMLILPL